jgi:hypothetical protein
MNPTQSFTDTYKEAYAELVPAHQAALDSMDWQTETIAIGKEFGLHVDELETLLIETMLVLIGSLPAAEFPSELTTELPLPPTELAKLMDEIGKRVFTPIHNKVIGQTEPIPAAPVEMKPEMPAPTVSLIPEQPLEPMIPTPTMPSSMQGMQIISENEDDAPDAIENINTTISPSTMIRAGIAPTMNDGEDDMKVQTTPPPLFSDQLRAMLSGTTGTQDRQYPADPNEPK